MAEAKTERNRQAFEMRQAGVAFKDIGAHFGISTSTARLAALRGHLENGPVIAHLSSYGRPLCGRPYVPRLPEYGWWLEGGMLVGYVRNPSKATCPHCLYVLNEREGRAVIHIRS